MAALQLLRSLLLSRLRQQMDSVHSLPQLLALPAPAAAPSLQQDAAAALPLLLLQQQHHVDGRRRSHHSASCSSSSHQHQHQHDSSCSSSDASTSAAAPPPGSFEAQEASCWSCHHRHHRGGLVCQACDVIQPSDPSLSYYDVMGYKPTFDLDAAALEKRYKLLQWTLHPDKSAGKTPQEQQYSAEQATRVNQAYGVLRQPLSRANYLLMLAGEYEEEHLEGTIADPELLSEVMEAREAVEDAVGDQEALVRMHAVNKARQGALCEQLSAAFAAGELPRARELTAQLSYWVRLEEAIAANL